MEYLKKTLFVIFYFALNSIYCFSQWNVNSIDTITKDNHPDFIPELSKLVAIDEGLR